jgi:hypothetical protein
MVYSPQLRKVGLDTLPYGRNRQTAYEPCDDFALATHVAG